MSLKTELSAAQNLLLETVYSQREAHKKAAFSRSGLAKKDRKECIKTAQGLIADPKTRIAINVDLRLRVHKDMLAEALHTCGRLLNLFELDTALGNQDDYNMRLRLLKEFRIYGAKNQIGHILAYLPDDEHPIYGILDYIGDPLKMRGTYYGMYRFVLKRDFLERTTFTRGDSFNIESEDVFCWEDIAGVLISHPHPLGGQRWYEYVKQGRSPSHSSADALYIEAQVLGPVHLSDVEHLYYPCRDAIDPWFMTVLQSLAEKYKFTLSHY